MENYKMGLPISWLYGYTIANKKEVFLWKLLCERRQTIAVYHTPEGSGNLYKIIHLRSRAIRYTDAYSLHAGPIRYTERSIGYTETPISYTVAAIRYTAE